MRHTIVYFWAISPLQQKNIYIISDIVFYEGFKEEIKTGYSLTLWEIGDPVRYETELYVVLFDLLAKKAIEKYGDSTYTPTMYGREENKNSDAVRNALKNATKKCLEEVKDTLMK